MTPMRFLAALAMALVLSGCFTLPATPTVTPFEGPGIQVGKNDLEPGTQVSFRHAQNPNDFHVRIVARQLGTEGFETTTGETIRFENVTNIKFIKRDSNARMRIESAKESALIPVVLACMVVGGCPIQ